MPTISVIMPVYNTAAYLPRALEAIARQTFRDFEVLCVDNGSTDDSLAVLRAFCAKDARFYALSIPKKGVAAARNAGLAAAQGTYFMFCDSDDWYEPDLCETLLNALREADADLSGCLPRFAFENDAARRHLKEGRRLASRYYGLPFRGVRAMTTFARLHTNVLLWNKLWRASIIREHGLAFPEGMDHEDDAFWYCYSFYARKLCFVPRRLYHYTIRGDSTMERYYQKKPANIDDRFRSIHFVCAHMKAHGLLDTYRADFAQMFREQAGMGLRLREPAERPAVIAREAAWLARETGLTLFHDGRHLFCGDPDAVDISRWRRFKDFCLSRFSWNWRTRAVHHQRLRDARAAACLRKKS